jgi:rhamnosyltransferase
MLKIAGVVVLYNPDEKINKNILSYIDNIDKLYVIDNTENKNNRKMLPKDKKIIYIPNNKNLGIAVSLNIGANEAINDGYDWLLTMDQDSKFVSDNLDRMIKWLDANHKKNIGLISPWHELNIGLKKVKEEIDYPLTVMTSGNIINLNAFKKIGGFKEYLFIDCVDFDYCLNLIKHNYKVIRLNNIELKHELGSIKVDKFLFKSITHSNHSYIRRYYMTRNSYIVGNMYKNKFPEFYKTVMKEVRRDIIKIIILEKDKYRKIRNMIRGYIDYKKGITGEYRYKN